MSTQKTIAIRTDTEKTQDETKPVDHDRQQVCFALAIKGEGKSNLIESLAQEEFRLGYLVLDLHAPISGNMENAFWCIPKLDGEEEILAFRKNPIPFLRKRKCSKITLLASESIIYDQRKLDRYNDRLYTEAEWYEDHRNNPTNYFNCVEPPLKPKSKWGKELIRVVKIPHVSAQGNTEADKKAIELIVKEMLSARTDRRYIVLNRKMISSERQYFWLLEAIIRNLQDFSDKYCIKKFPSEVGVKTRAEMKPKDRNWHKMCVITREMGELAPAKFKADKSGESTTVKRSLLQLARTCRHSDSDWFGDWQRRNDVAPEVRDQADTWFFKKYNLGLGGVDTERFFQVLQEKRDWLANTIRNKVKARLLIKSRYPDITKLSKKYFYAYFLSENVRLFKVQENLHQHKEQDMKFHIMTGVWFDHDPNKIPKSASPASKKLPLSDQKALFDAYTVLRSGKGKNKLTGDQICVELGKMQDKGELNYPSHLSDKDGNWLSATISKLKRKFPNQVDNTTKK